MPLCGQPTTSQRAALEVGDGDRSGSIAAAWGHGERQVLAVPTVEAGHSLSDLPFSSDINLFRYRKGVIDLDPEITNSALDLGVSQE
jgi:hypothetical protein